MQVSVTRTRLRTSENNVPKKAAGYGIQDVHEVKADYTHARRKSEAKTWGTEDLVTPPPPSPMCSNDFHLNNDTFKKPINLSTSHLKSDDVTSNFGGTAFKAIEGTQQHFI